MSFNAAQNCFCVLIGDLLLLHRSADSELQAASIFFAARNDILRGTLSIVRKECSTEK